jgi:hypothetical protein
MKVYAKLMTFATIITVLVFAGAATMTLTVQPAKALAPPSCGGCAKDFAPGQEAVSPGDASNFAPGHEANSEIPAKDFAPGQVFKKGLN